MILVKLPSLNRYLPLSPDRHEMPQFSTDLEANAMAQVLAGSSAFCFGTAIVTSRFGLRGIDARAGAAISIPSAALLLLVASPFFLNASAFAFRAALVFGVVGFLFPALVAVLRFHATERLGSTVTGAVMGTGPLFAVGAASLWLDEIVPARAVLATLGVVGGIGLLSCKSAASTSTRRGWWLALPIAAAAIAGCAQASIKSGLLLWPNPFAATLICYSVSSVTVLAIDALRKAKPARRAAKPLLWFAFTGVLNGAGVLSMYTALNSAPVSSVAPIVAAYPLVTLLFGAALLREETIDMRVIAGALLTVAAIGYLVSG